MRTATTFLILSLLLTAGLARSGEPVKLPAPDMLKQKDAEKTIKEIFKTDYVKTQPEERAALAKKLLEQAEATAGDPPGEYVLLREARDIAALSGDNETGLAAIDAMNRNFAINVIAEKIAYLRKALDAARTKERIRPVATAAFPVVREAIAADQYDSLKQLTAILDLASVRAGDKELAAQIKDVTTLAADVQKEWLQVKPALEKLKAAPNDPLLNLTVGKFYCFMKGDFKRGIPALALSNSKEFKALAEKEMTRPTDPAAMAAIGDAWWDAAEKMTGMSKQFAKAHAVEWYVPAVAKLQGLSRAKAEARIMTMQSAEAIESAVLADRNKLPKTATLTLPMNVAMEFVLVPAGKFQMGSADGFPDQQPVHPVTISKPFYMSKYEVTTEQYETLMLYRYRSQGPKFPVSAKFDDAVEFCKLFSQHSGRKIRLPTEAEWEYACRAGTTTAFNTGNGVDAATKAAWFGEEQPRGHEVGGKAPNAWGLFDMHGNMYEWCSDWYDPEFYSKSPAVDPHNTTPGTQRVLRGGSCNMPADQCDSAMRRSLEPDSEFGGLGFRVVLEAAPAAQKAGATK